MKKLKVGGIWDRSEGGGGRGGGGEAAAAAIYLDAEIRYQRKPYNSCGFFVGFWFLPFCFGVWNAGGRREK